MDKEIYIVFKKNKDNDNYSFYNIFVMPIGDKIQLEDDNVDEFSFCSGLVAGVKDNVLENVIQSNSDMLSFSSFIQEDDGNDSYFSVLIDSKQLKKFIPMFQIEDEINESGMVSFIEKLYKMCDGISSLSIKKDESCGTVISEVKFVQNRDEVEARSTDYIRKIIGLVNVESMYDNNMRMIEDMARSFGTRVYEINPDDEDSSEIQDFTDIDVQSVISEIKKKVVAQDETVETIVNNIYTNQRIIDTADDDFINSSKVNILLDGPSGTGKTLIVSQVARQLSLPIVVRPITSFSTVGYRGADLTELLVELLDKAGGNLELAERGIIVLDEFDKLASRDSSRGLEIKYAVQQELLSYIGGGKHSIDYKGKKITFDTSKITFIGCGAFTDLRERKIKENSSSSIGFASSNDKEKNSYTISIQDYIDEGLQKEIVGRFTLFTSTNHFEHNALVEILNKSTLSPVKSLVKVGKMYDVDIIISDEIISLIADYALVEGTEARALQEIVNNLKNILLPSMISSRKDRIVITEELLKKSRQFMIRGY